MNYKLDLQRTVVLPDLGIVVPPKPRHGSVPPLPPSLIMVCPVILNMVVSTEPRYNSSFAHGI